jgi:pyrimidine operon attenuation protein/uracil phosphoribosyltransferase
VTDPTGEHELLSAGDVARTIARMAHQVIEKTALDAHARPLEGGEGASGGVPVVLLGVPTRGTPLAHRLAAKIAEFSGVRVPTGTLDVTLYRDDLRRRPTRPLERTMLPPGGIDDRLVVLVDDVLYSGRTIRAALDALRDHGRPRAVQLAVLVDRGHREVPIRADYVGKNVPTSRTEEVAVRLTEVDGSDGVVLRRAGGGPIAGSASGGPTAGSAGGGGISDAPKDAQE